MKTWKALRRQSALWMAAGAVFSASSAMAATWTGNTDNLWATAGNWSGGVPTKDTDAIFNSNPTNKNVDFNNGAATTRDARSLLFQQGAGAFNIAPTGAGNNFLRMPGVVDGSERVIIQMDANVANDQTVGMRPRVWVESGVETTFAIRNLSSAHSLTIGGTIDSTSGGTSTVSSLLINAVGNISLSGIGNSSNPGVNIKNVTKTGGGTLTVASNNQFAGFFAIEEGTLSVALVNNKNANGSLGGANNNQPVKLGANGHTATLEYTRAAGGQTTDRKFVLGAGSTGEFKIVNLNSPLTLSEAIDEGEGTGRGSLAKSGAGILALAGANTYTGNSTVTAGTLRLDATGSLRMAIENTLADTTRILGTAGGSETAVLNGKLELDVSGFTGGSNMSWNIVDFTNMTPTIGDTFAIDFVGGGGAFTKDGSLWSASSGGKDWVFNQGNGVLSVVVPEPTALGGVLVGLSLVSLRRRRISGRTDG